MKRVAYLITKHATGTYERSTFYSACSDGFYDRVHPLQPFPDVGLTGHRQLPRDLPTELSVGMRQIIESNTPEKTTETWLCWSESPEHAVFTVRC